MFKYDCERFCLNTIVKGFVSIVIGFIGGIMISCLINTICDFIDNL